MAACFTVSMLSKKFGLSPTTIRRLVQEGIVGCKKGSRGQYLFEPEELNRIAKIVRLKQELGVNLAGIDIIMRLLDRIEELNKELDALRPDLPNRAEKPTIGPTGYYPAPMRVIKRELVHVRVIESD